MQFEAGSYRDPKGQVFYHNERIYRIIRKSAKRDVLQQFDSGLIDRLIEKDFLINSKLVDNPCPDLIKEEEDSFLFIEHEKIPFISYPYEWSFSQLKDAALFHINFQLQLLSEGWTLSDATAYNIQFVGAGCNPIFIDQLSIIPYMKGSYWLAQKQFVEQFLVPLYLTSYYGVSFNNWYRGNIEGIPADDIVAFLPFRSKFSLTLLTNIILPAYFQKKSLQASKGSNKRTASLIKRPFPKSALTGQLRRLQKFIERLDLYSLSVWGKYSKDNSYSSFGETSKVDFLSSFYREQSDKVLWDIGCNDGRYAELALENGVKTVVGFDFDKVAINNAYLRAKESCLSFLPLYLDAVNPSSSLGWLQSERKGFQQRINADCLVALAFIHHICIGKNIPIIQAVEWLTSLAPQGIIEFVGKSDETVVEMLALRDDIFDDYSYENFLKLLSKKCQIVSEMTVPDSSRHLIWYKRKY